MKVLISHIDLDGLSCNVLQKLYSTKIPFDKIYNLDYGWETDSGIVKELSQYDEIVFADMSCPIEIYQEWIDAGKIVRIFDHHDSAEVFIGKPDCIIDKTRCGAKIFFEEYVCKYIGRFRSIVAEYLELVNTYDLWQLDSLLWSKALDLNRVLYKYTYWNAKEIEDKYGRFFDSILRKLQTDKEFKFNLTEIQFIEDARESENKAYIRALDTLKVRQDHRGKLFAIFLAWGKISITASKLLYEYTDPALDYVIAVQDYNNVYGRLSIRSRRGANFDCTKLGIFGGHIEASGCNLTPEQALYFYEKNVCFKYKDEITNENDIFQVLPR